MPRCCASAAASASRVTYERGRPVPCCNNCAFAQDADVTLDKKTYDVLRCRRFPPLQHPTHVAALFPIVQKDEWCGEYRPDTPPAHVTLPPARPRR